MENEQIVVYTRNCNDCKHSSGIGWSVVCNNSKRPKDACIGRLDTTRGAIVRPTMPGCSKWEQGKPCLNIIKSPF
jgi:hypothetical protein